MNAKQFVSEKNKARNREPIFCGSNYLAPIFSLYSLTERVPTLGFVGVV